MKVFDRAKMKLIEDWGKSKSWEKLFALKQYSSGNHVDLYFNGSDAFKALWEEITEAKHRIWIETYQLAPDSVGLKTIELLTEAAKRGVNVVLLYDPIGSYTIRNSHLQPLVEANATVISYSYSVIRHHLSKKFSWNKLWKYWIPPWLGRNHRKLVIIDNSAYCGGMNISSDYAGADVGGNGRFYDTHCRIRGPALEHFVNLYLKNLKNTSPVLWAKLKNWSKERRILPKRFERNASIQIYETDSLRNRSTIKEVLNLKLDHAKESLDIVTPYFLPPHKIEHAILEAAGRGVQIRLITQGLCKTPIINTASQHILGKFISAGVKIYQMHDQELHAKYIIVDELFGMLGSFNIDELSLEVNMECGFSVFGGESIDLLSKNTTKILPLCKELTLDELESRSNLRKVWQWVCYVLCRLGLSRRWNLRALFWPNQVQRNELMKK
jgi:cardiolipin synthase